MKLVGNYRYGRAIYEDSRYVIVKNGDMLKRIIVPAVAGQEHRVIWSCGDPMTPEIIANARKVLDVCPTCAK